MRYISPQQMGHCGGLYNGEKPGAVGCSRLLAEDPEDPIRTNNTNLTPVLFKVLDERCSIFLAPRDTHHPSHTIHLQCYIHNFLAEDPEDPNKTNVFYHLHNFLCNNGMNL